MRLVHSGHREVVDGDLANYFGEIPHCDLIRSIARRVSDGRMLGWIKMWLEMAVIEDDGKGGKRRTNRARRERKGTPQDTAPHSESAALAAARAADLALVPLRPGLFDIAALDATTWETEMPETDNPFADVLSRPDGETAPSPRPSRNRGPGTVTIAGHFSPAVHRQLRLLGVMQDRTVQSLLGEALNELFRKHGKPPIARE